MQRTKPDFWLILLTFILVGYGLVMVFSTSYYKGILDYQNAYYFFNKQLIFAGIGLVLFFIFSNIPYHWYRKHIGKFLLASLFMLIFVLLFASETNGARRWISLGPLTFQPSEFVKIVMIMYTASIMVKKQEVLNNFKKTILPPLTVITIFCGFLVIQPHYSATIIIFSTCMIVIFCGGARLRQLFLLIIAGVPVLVGVLFLDQYRVNRVMALFNPFSDPQNHGYQVIYSLYAIGPGGITGVGLGKSIQKMAYLPEAHTDFIFSIIAEELGFIGAGALIVLFAVYVVKGVRIALRAPDLFGTLLGIGIVSLLAIQVVFNLGVVTALLPVTGVPLPFISYGGSSLLFQLIATGILLNISRYRLEKRKPTIETENEKPATE
jgi:cell division protein FtsW